jgi:glucose/arabinose dehydrogenase
VLAGHLGSPLRTVLDLTDRVLVGRERGLLGLAFSPTGSRLYVHYSGRPAGHTVVDEYTMVDDVADPHSRRPVFTYRQPQRNHNGGQLSFGPDGRLYLALGDGGGYGDQGAGHAPGGNGQSLATLLGKILRLDVGGVGGAPYSVPPDNPFVNRPGRDEIWVYGLRNPWRFSFDRVTGDLWIADVGQNHVEEIDRLAPGTAAGANLGWNVFEGNRRFRDGAVPNHVRPVYELDHAGGNCSITGGYVYRGSRIPKLVGWYVFTDYCNGRLRAIHVESTGRVRAIDLGASAERVSSFGEGNNGELYVLSQSQGIFRIDPVTGAP